MSPVRKASRESSNTRWTPDHLDRSTLPRLLAEAGFRPPDGFKALVVWVSPGADIPEYLFYDYDGTSQDRDDWWPASTIKVFAAVAALERLRGWGFTPKATVTFHYPKGEVVRSAEWLVRQAITHSDNAAFDQLVEIVGGDEMNAWLRDQHLHHTVLLRGYSRRYMDRRSGHGILRISAAITIRETGQAPRHVPARRGRQREGCRDLGNCTSLWDLADGLRRVMLHERLPESERFALGPAEVDLLRSALAGKRERGLGVVNGLRAGFNPTPIVCYHKPGFALDWFSDHVFVTTSHAGCEGPSWIVAMAAHGGRGVLDEAARVVGRILASGRLGPPRPSGVEPASGRCGRSVRPPRRPRGLPGS